MSPIFRNGASTSRSSTATSSASGGRRADGGFGSVTVCQRPAMNIETSPRSRRCRAARATRASADRCAARNASGVCAGQILDDAVIGEDLHLGIGKRDRDESIGVGDSAALGRNGGAGPRRAGRAVVPVGDVERGQRRKRLTPAPAHRRPSPARACARCRRRRGSRRCGRADVNRRTSESMAGGPYVRKTTPVCARSSVMWRVRSSSLSLRVRSCFLIRSRSYSSTEKQPASPVCSCEPIRSRYR